MSESQSQPLTALETEAADWYARLRAPDVSKLDAVRFRAWLFGDPARRREFDELDAFWADLAAIEKSPEVLQVDAEIEEVRRRARRWRRHTSWGIAASLVLAIAGGWAAWQQWAGNRVTTDIGEQRIVPLADGSVVTLNTATELKVQYSKAAREVRLLRGQANFDVAKDSARPFIVTAGGGQVRALGTVFDVYKANDQVIVTLIEGKVAVTPLDTTTSGPSPPSSSKVASGSSERAPVALTAANTRKVPEIVLAAGEQLSYTTLAASAVKPVSADVPRVTAWRARKLEFSRTPIFEAIAEANRYSRDQIVLEAPALKDARITGTFEAGKNDLFVEGLQSLYRLDADRTADHKIILTSRSR